MAYLIEAASRRHVEASQIPSAKDLAGRSISQRHPLSPDGEHIITSREPQSTINTTCTYEEVKSMRSSDLTFLPVYPEHIQPNMSTFLPMSLIPGVGSSWQPPTDQDKSTTLRLKCQARSDDFGRKISQRFVLPDELLHQQSDHPIPSPLLALPSEILLHIFSSIAHSPSQIVFALTCKKLAHLASRTDLSLSLASPRYAGFLPVSVFDVPDLMVHLKPWMPAHLRLCGHCLTYRPSASEYWQSVPGHERNDFWIQKPGWVFKDAGWRKQTHDICPACHYNCSLSDYVPCDGCRALGRLGDVDWSRVSDSWRPRPNVTADAVDGLTRS